ncbi:MAG: acyl-CoA dehydrogenase family protein [Deltaproteobacteria bacterium]|nr:acyl-CoA dehydrogenase family protein [Deltaproteobacteria bacterium]
MNLKKLKRLLENDNHDYREKLKLLMSDPIFTPRFELSLKEQRNLAFTRLQKLFRSGMVDLHDFETDHRRIFALHDICGLIDGSLATKLTVQLNLFSGTVLKFGNRERWQRLREQANRLEAVGCFALTELGYGNNAVAMETEAVYNHSLKCFVINTPSTLAQKYWITNGYCHAHWAVVFAQLKVKGQSQGVHGFLVRIRNEDLSPVEGVTIQDMGMKMGLNGVDNARLWFEQVMVPRDNLLDAFSTIDDEGNFHSKVEGKRNRFLKMADQLLSGRLCIASMMMAATKMSLLIALRYSQKRKAVGTDGESSWPLLNFELQRRALIPLLARTYALSFALNRAKNEFSFVENSREQIINCCAMKALVTWHAEHTVSVCRERCGGQGYLAANMFAEFLAGAHAGETAEGDNSVLMQKVAKELLSGISSVDLLRMKSKQYIGFKASKLTKTEEVLRLLHKREDILKAHLALKMQKASRGGKEEGFRVWMMEESETVQGLAKAYGEHFALQSFLNILQEGGDDPVLAKLAQLFAFQCLEDNLTLFWEQGLITRSLAKSVHMQVSKLSAELVPYVSYLLDGFNIPEYLIHAPIARDFIVFNQCQNDNQGETYQFSAGKGTMPEILSRPQLSYSI